MLTFGSNFLLTRLILTFVIRSFQTSMDYSVSVIMVSSNSLLGIAYVQTRFHCWPITQSLRDRAAALRRKGEDDARDEAAAAAEVSILISLVVFCRRR